MLSTGEQLDSQQNESSFLTECLMSTMASSDCSVESQVSLRELQERHLLVVPGDGGQDLLPPHPDHGVVGAEGHVVPGLDLLNGEDRNH